MSQLTILSVAFPFAPVSRDAVGGAEQALAQIDEELVHRGHRSLVIASGESDVAGALIRTPSLRAHGCVTDEERHRVHETVREAIARAIEGFHPDLVHMHGVDFVNYVPAGDVPVLVTLHLPFSYYNVEPFPHSRAKTYFQCVSKSQRALFPSAVKFLPEIENGVRAELLESAAQIRKRDFVVSLGRICPEKGFHLAVRAAKEAGVGMLLAGQVFPYETHERYFAEKIVPELDERRRFIGAVGLKQKRRLLWAARCLMVTSLVPETSSLVAREALACGTPVVALDCGAIRDVIEDGKTGFVVREPRDLPEAIGKCAKLDGNVCRRTARERFSPEKMLDQYIAMYEQILGQSGRKSHAA